MVGDESCNSTTGTGSGQSVRMVKTGFLNVSTATVLVLPPMEKTKQKTNRPEFAGQEAERQHYSDDIFLETSKGLSDEKNCAVNGDSKSKILRSLLEDGSKALVAGNSRLALNNYQEVFDRLSKLPTFVFKNVKDYIWFKYAHFISMIEVNNFPDLINAHKSLQELQTVLFSERPTYRYAVAKLLVKFNRFQLAEEELQKCRDEMVGHDFQKHFWPCTEEVIKEATHEGLEEYLEEVSEACKWHDLPDASCKFKGCLSSNSRPYPSREIFHSDPNFKGYVVLICQEGCKVHYHSFCWKNIKETFTNFDKLTDKECLGKPCLTPDCKNSANQQSVIHKIEIIGPDGKVKSQCVQDQSAEIRQKEILLKKRQRQISDEHKTDKATVKSKQKPKKGPERSQSGETLPVSMKNPPPKDNKAPQICGSTNAKAHMPAKGKQSWYQEMSNLAGQSDFICSYFMMLVNTSGPLPKERVEEEWEKFYPIFKPMAGLVSKNCGIFNLLKKSPNFVIVDDLLCIRESSEKFTEKDKESTREGQAMSQPQAIPSPPTWQKESKIHPEPLKQPEPPKQPKPIKLSEPLKQQLEPPKQPEPIRPPEPILQIPSDKNLTTLKGGERKLSWAEETSLLNLEMKEIEKELQMTRLHDQVSMNNLNSSDFMDPKLLESPVKDRTKVNEEIGGNIANQHITPGFNRPFAFDFLDANKAERNISSSNAKVDHRKVTGIALQKSAENIPLLPHPESFFVVPPPPVHWPGEGLQPPKNLQFGNPDAFKQMLMFPHANPIDPCFGFQHQNHREISVQTDEKWESKSTNDDETWVQHMQSAVNELLKKNKDLMQGKEELVQAHQNEVDALKNQMKTLRQSYEHYIESLKETLNRNDDDKRRVMALDQRMKLQEQILNSTKEELRNKDFDLLEARKYIGTAILERIEHESTRQVERMVSALASLPCNSKEAELVGQAMSNWESTGDQASRAKAEFLAACIRHQAKLIDGYGSDTLKELVLPTVEVPSGPCPLDALAIKLLQDKELSDITTAKTHMSAPLAVPGFRTRPITVGTAATPVVPAASTSPLPGPSGARPREPLVGEAPLRSWASSQSIYSTHSLSGGTARALTNFRKLLIELKRCYPSRTEDELVTAVKLARRKNTNTLSGLSIERIVSMVGSTLEWWPEPVDGSMGLDKFMGWASDVTAVDETFCSVSKAPKGAVGWPGSTSSPVREGDKEDCCICLQGMSDPKTELSCSHSFHTQCIRKWLSKESVCPICRKFTRMPDEFPTLK